MCYATCCVHDVQSEKWFPQRFPHVSSASVQGWVDITCKFLERISVGFHRKIHRPATSVQGVQGPSRVALDGVGVGPELERHTMWCVFYREYQHRPISCSPQTTCY